MIDNVIWWAVLIALSPALWRLLGCVVFAWIDARCNDQLWAWLQSQPADRRRTAYAAWPLVLVHWWCR